MQRPTLWFTTILALSVSSAPVLAQKRPTLVQLLDNRNALTLTFTFSRSVYFVGEPIKGTITATNNTASPLTVPQLFNPDGGTPFVAEIDPDTGEQKPGQDGTVTVDLGEEPYAAPFPLETLAPGQSKTITLNPLDPTNRFSHHRARSTPGKYLMQYWTHISNPFDVVKPPVEAVAQALWPEMGGGDPNVPPEFDPPREIYRIILSARWKETSRICVSENLTESIAGLESSKLGENGLLGIPGLVCFAESALPIVSVSASHDAAKNLTVNYVDTQQVQRSFRVDQDLNLLP